ncbi:hypothetical protein JCM10212_007121 [Sporobolomyces blumeae]
MDIKREEGRHRASSDPLSRGGNFANGSGGRLDQEPNPFEQSFSGPGPSKATDGTITAGGRRARSTSPSSLIPRATPGSAGAKLPPLSFMQTPGGGDLTNFGWGVDSLRTGPLSPALLNGPTYVPDGSSLRTGLTPLVGGAAPPGPPGGGGGGVGGGQGAPGAGSGSAGVSFPPPSPATAALFAMMTNNTPGTADASALAGGGPRPHEGPNEGNQFEASFARANSDSKIPPTSEPTSMPATQPPMHHTQTHPGTFSDLHRSAINNTLMNGSQGHHPPPPPHGHHAPHPQAYLSYPQHPPGPYPPHVAPHLAHLAPHGQHHPHPHPPPHSQHAHSTYTSAPPPAPPSNATNPLDLLSQASFHNDDAVVAAAALSGLATPGGGFNAAAVAALNAAQNGQPQPTVQNPPPGVMPGSTVGTGANGNGPFKGVKEEPMNGSTAAAGRGKRAASSTTGGNGTTKRTKRGQAGSAGAVSEEPELSGASAAGANNVVGNGGGEGGGGAGTKKSQPKRAASKRGAAAKRKTEEDDEAMMGGFDDNGSMMGDMDDDMMDEQAPAGAAQANKGGRGRKKDTGETEEEKRKNFLERNRQAALKCRQRKKAWLQSLQTKVELLTTDNDTLQTTVTNLTEEVNSLRAILAAHSNCPVAIANGAQKAPPPPGIAQQHAPPPPHHHGVPPGMQGVPAQQGYAQARY